MGCSFPGSDELPRAAILSNCQVVICTPSGNLGGHAQVDRTSHSQQRRISSPERQKEKDMQPTRKTDANILNFYTASEAYDPQGSSRHFTGLSSIARLALMGAFQGDALIYPEVIESVFPTGDDQDDNASTYTVSTFSIDEMTDRERRRLEHLYHEPGLEHAAGIELAPRPGEFCMLVTEGPAKHICAAVVFRVSVCEGYRRSIEERQWSGDMPGPTLDMKLAYRAAVARRHADPEQEQKLHTAIAAFHATQMTHAVRRTNDGLEANRAHAWVTIGCQEVDEPISRNQVNHALLRTIEDGIYNEAEGISQDGMPYQGFDGIEAA